MSKSKEVANFDHLIASTQGMTVREAIKLFSSDSVTFDAFYTRLMQLTATVANKRGRTNEAGVMLDYEDLVQSALTKAYKQTTTLETNVLAYLMTAITRQVYDVGRAKQRIQLTELQETTGQPSPEHISEPLEVSLSPQHLLFHIRTATHSAQQQLILFILFRDKMSGLFEYREALDTGIHTVLKKIIAQHTSKQSLQMSFDSADHDFGQFANNRTHNPTNTSIVKQFFHSLEQQGLHISINPGALKRIVSLATATLNRDPALLTLWLQLIHQGEIPHHLVPALPQRKRAVVNPNHPPTPASPQIRKKQKEEQHHIGTIELSTPSELRELIHACATSPLSRLVLILYACNKYQAEQDYLLTLLEELVSTLTSIEEAQYASLRLTGTTGIHLATDDIPILEQHGSIPQQKELVQHFLERLEKKGVTVQYQRTSVRSLVYSTNKLIRNNSKLYALLRDYVQSSLPNRVTHAFTATR